ncbi:MAG TPA: RnfABCDGE type electron transport complex subunit D [Candidatus Omnitrophota bacterium]|nr:RnfABCDGE type electron transport complex subunit D [Candidatus Omnitrophota bacterium]HRY85047.1 RnfABCDGE type electron transport complex subunit D [Candidatus Omnitrophota bacterium]
MVDLKTSSGQTISPYIHSQNSLSRRYGRQTLALIPLFLAACLTGHAEVLRTLLISLVSGVAFDFLSAKIFGKKERLQTGEIVFMASVFSLLLPSRCPSELVVLGMFLAVVGARELFGGTGACPFHPLLLSRVFLQICFPGVMVEPALFAGESSVWTFAALLLSAGIFFDSKQGRWETPLLFMAACFFCEALFGGEATPLMFFSGVLFTAFFLLADPSGMPLTKKGAAFFVLGAALLSSRLDPGGFSIASAGYAVLFMNLLTPWLDAGFKPAPYRAKNLIQATYPYEH